MQTIIEAFSRIREKKPLIHFLTNYVTVNDCANITLACGGSPIMADEIKEVEEIVSLASAVVINIGTANDQTAAAMLRTGCYANQLDIPVILDPVGAGISKFRNNLLQILLKEINFTAIKGNISEMKYLSDGICSTQGVDASFHDLVSEENLSEMALYARKLSVITGSMIAITGPIDLVADSQRVFMIRNGCSTMSSVTGTGCMGGAVLGCTMAANPPEIDLEAAVTAIAAMGICGELAYEQMQKYNYGLNTYRNLIIDAISQLDASIFEARQKIEQF